MVLFEALQRLGDWKATLKEHGACEELEADEVELPCLVSVYVVKLKNFP